MSDLHKNPGIPRHRYRIAGDRDEVKMSHDAPTNGHIDDLAASYALDALEPSERRMVEHHCRSCTACAELLAAERRVVSLLPFAVPAARPAPDVKVALFARIAQAQQAAKDVDLPTRRIPTLPPTLTIPASRASATPLPPPAVELAAPWVAERSRTRLGWATSLLSVPLLLALLVTGYWGMQMRSQVAKSTSTVSELQAQVANFGSDSLSYPLRPGPAASNKAQGQLIIGADQRGGKVLMNLNTAGSKRSYQLIWMNQDGKLVSATDVPVDEQGVGQATFKLEHPYSEYQRVEVQAKPLTVGSSASDANDEVLLLDSRDLNGEIGTGDPSSNDATP